MKYENYTQQKRAKALRANSTDAEKRLWAVLRNRQIEGLKFRRQVAFGPFIADFYCAEAMLVVEADGRQHAEQASYDADRSAFFTREGFRVLRFWNNEILDNLEGVVEVIRSEAHVAHRPSPYHASRGPLPLPLRERGL